jgi:energy-coupling factor transport system substrate-specific component
MVSEVSAKKTRIPLTYVVAMVPVAAALNIVGGAINAALRLPTFLDMIGTAVVAITLGPWWGALVGVITNVGTAIIRNPVSLPFAFCNVVGALVWGYGIRWGMGKTFLRYLVLSILVAFFVSLTAVPIYVFVFGGATGHFADMMTGAFVGMGQNLVVSVFSSNILVSLTDKIISAFVALAILGALPRNLTAHLDIIEERNLRTIIIVTLGIVIGLAALLVIMFTGVAG